MDFGTPLVSAERLKPQTVCVVHLMQPLPNYFGFLLLILLESGLWTLFKFVQTILYMLEK